MVKCDKCPFSIEGHDVGTRNCVLDGDYPRRNLIYENHKFQMPDSFCKLELIVLKDGTTYRPEVIPEK